MFEYLAYLGIIGCCFPVFQAIYVWPMALLSAQFGEPSWRHILFMQSVGAILLGLIYGAGAAYAIQHSASLWRCMPIVFLGMFTIFVGLSAGQHEKFQRGDLAGSPDFSGLVLIGSTCVYLIVTALLTMWRYPIILWLPATISNILAVHRVIRAMFVVYLLASFAPHAFFPLFFGVGTIVSKFQRKRQKSSNPVPTIPEVLPQTIDMDEEGSRPILGKHPSEMTLEEFEAAFEDMASGKAAEIHKSMVDEAHSEKGEQETVLRTLLRTTIPEASWPSIQLAEGSTRDEVEGFSPGYARQDCEDCWIVSYDPHPEAMHVGGGRVIWLSKATGEIAKEATSE